jgi:multisubunit Na+/H+ antiporter MnhF subunit
MNGWLVAAAVLTSGLGACGLACLRGDLGAALVAAELAGTVGSVVLLLLAAGTGREAFADLALAAALASLTGALTYARYLAGRL